MKNCARGFLESTPVTHESPQCSAVGEGCPFYPYCGPLQGKFPTLPGVCRGVASENDRSALPQVASSFLQEAESYQSLDQALISAGNGQCGGVIEISNPIPELKRGLDQYQGVVEDQG